MSPSRSCARAPTFRSGCWSVAKRAETALITVVADCYLAGVSTQRMDKLVKTLGINALSKSQVSRMAGAETKEAWNTFLADLVARGLGGVRLVTSDAHPGLVEAITANLPGASWQLRRSCLPNPLRGEPDGHLSEKPVAGGQSHAALGL